MTQQVFHPSLFRKSPKDKRENKNQDNNKKTRTRGHNNPTSGLPVKPARPTLSPSSKVDMPQVNQSEMECIVNVNPNKSLGSVTDSQPNTHKCVIDLADPQDWQKVPYSRVPKRKRIGTPPTSPNVETNNTFNDLPLDPPDVIDNASNNIPLSRPPPIILYGVEDINKLSKLLESPSKAEHFKLKIVIDNVEEYKKIIDVIRSKGLIGHTFTRKDTKCCRIVIKNLHHTTPHSAITEAVETRRAQVAD